MSETDLYTYAYLRETNEAAKAGVPIDTPFHFSGGTRLKQANLGEETTKVYQDLGAHLFSFVTSKSYAHVITIINSDALDFAARPKESDWEAFEAMYGAWEDREDISEDWLDNLRARADTRLADLYDAD